MLFCDLACAALLCDLTCAVLCCSALLAHHSVALQQRALPDQRRLGMDLVLLVVSWERTTREQLGLLRQPAQPGEAGTGSHDSGRGVAADMMER